MDSVFPESELLRLLWLATQPRYIFLLHLLQPRLGVTLAQTSVFDSKVAVAMFTFYFCLSCYFIYARMHHFRRSVSHHQSGRQGH